METFLIICKEVIYAAKKQRLITSHPKIKKAMRYTVQKRLDVVTFGKN